MGDHAAEKVGDAERGLIHDHGHALGLDALHDALDARGAEVVAAGLHGQSVDAYDRGTNLGIHQLVHALQDLVGDEVLARAVAFDDGLDEVLGHVFVVGQELLCVLGQTVAAAAERGVVVEGADAGLQADAADDVPRGEAPALAIGVQLVEVSNPERQIGVGKELHVLGLGGAQDEFGDALGSVLVGAIMLGGIDALGQQGCKLLSRCDSLNVILRCTNHNTRGMKIVVKRMPLAQELRREEDSLVSALLAKRCRIAHWDGRLDDNPGLRVHCTHRIDGCLNARSVEEVLVGIIARGGGHHNVVGARVGLGGVHRSSQAQLTLASLGLAQETLNLRVAYRQLVVA